jgi:hypothetical protein
MWYNFMYYLSCIMLGNHIGSIKTYVVDVVFGISCQINEHFKLPIKIYECYHTTKLLCTAYEQIHYDLLSFFIVVTHKPEGELYNGMIFACTILSQCAVTSTVHHLALEAKR